MLTSKGIVLSRENFGEADCYLRVLTQDWGVVTALAKSARKSRRRYVGGLDLFCHIEISLRGNPHHNPYLDELKVLNSFWGLRENIDRVFAAGRCLHWVQRLIPEATQMADVYSLLGQTLALLEKQESSERIVLLELVFKLKLIRLLGLKPEVSGCGREDECRAKTGQVFLDMSSGSIACSACAAGRPLLRQNSLTLEQRQFLTLADDMKLGAWDRVDMPIASSQHLNKMLTQFTSFHTHVHLQ